jgi:hypothetical protein
MKIDPGPGKNYHGSEYHVPGGKNAPDPKHWSDALGLIQYFSL